MTTEQQANAESAAAKVAALSALYAAGTITREAFTQVFAAIVYGAKIRAARLAEIDLFRWSLTNWPEPIEPLGIAPGPEVLQTLQKAAETITADAPEPVPEDVLEGAEEPVEDIEDPEAGTARLSFWTGVETSSSRVARDAAEETGRDTKQARMRRAEIPAWRWVAQPDACEECRRRDGNVYRISIKFRDHPQCLCDLEPATDEEVRISERKRAAAKRKREAHAEELSDPAGAEHGAGRAREGAGAA
ncbi:hypothetical protein [Aeromicrobium sp.]|uniref:hypothetical protein n=1 Tax=Aeromicrobium sp. TaxID=1871063 RepID=UPI0030C19914